MAARSNYGVKVCTHRSLRHPRSWCADMLMRSAHFLSNLDCLLHRSPVTIPVGSSVMDAQYFAVRARALLASWKTASPWPRGGRYDTENATANNQFRQIPSATADELLVNCSS